jgi:HEAT repeat protein
MGRVNIRRFLKGCAGASIAVLSAVGMPRAQLPTVDQGSAAAVFADAIKHDRALTRPEYLSFLITSQPYELPLLARAMGSRDARARRVAALQLGELKREQLNDEVINLLVQGVRDPDSGVSNLAVASIIRLGGIKPELLLRLIRETMPLRDLEYESEAHNAGRTLGITASDLAIAGLYYGSDVNLDVFLDAYSNAVQKEAQNPKPSKPSEAGPLEPSSDDPGSSAYFANALWMLLAQSPERHTDTITRLFDSQYPGLRIIAYKAAPGVIAPEVLTDRLAAAVRDHATSEEGNIASRSLAQSAKGKDALLGLARDPIPAVRMAALTPLMLDADCTSPFLMLAVGDKDDNVRDGVLKAMFRRQNPYMPCLAPLVSDNNVSFELRHRVISSLDPGDTPVSADQVQNIFRSLHPILFDPGSELYGPSWEAFSRMVHAAAKNDHEKPTLEVVTPVVPPDTETEIAAMAGSRVRTGLTEKDAGLICLVHSVNPKLLLKDVTSVEGLVRDLEIDRDRRGASRLRECVVDTLSKVNFSTPEFSRLSESIFLALSARKYLIPDELNLLQKNIPAEIFARNWRSLLLNKTEASLLEIYRIAVLRGFATDETIALCRNILSQETDPQYVMEPAIAALVAAGDRGVAALGEILRGDAGSTVGRRYVTGEMYKLDRGIAVKLQPDLIAATRDKVPDIRVRAANDLAMIVDGGALISAIRPLLTDNDSDVKNAIVGLVTDDASTSKIFESLSIIDEQHLLESASKHPDPRVRENAPSLLVRLRDRLPPDYITMVLKGLLLDPDESPRDAALGVVKDLGTLGTHALQEVLVSPEGTVLFDELPSGLAPLGSEERQNILPTILALRERNPESPSLLKTIGVLAGDNPTTAALLNNALFSDSDELTHTAFETLPVNHFFDNSSQYYIAVLVEQTIGGYIASYLGNVLEQIRPYRGGTLTSGKESNLPDFPWPAPRWSFKEVVPRSFFGNEKTTLGEVSDRLVAAVRGASPDFDYGLFSIPGGFVTLARLERINADGSPYPGRLRWDSDLISPQSLEEYLVDLFFSPPGYFRVIAFAITDKEPIRSDQDAKLPSISEGAKLLPKEIADLPFSGRQVFALVYTFQRYDGAKMVLNYDSSPSGLTHLIASGIWQRLQAAGSPK